MALRVARIAALLCIVACGEHAGSADAGGADAGGADAGGQSSASSASRDRWVAQAESKPEIAAWLYLRAAAETPDSADRARLYQRVNVAVARDRIPWVEARARENFGDTTGALSAYRALGATATVLRLRAALASTPVASDSVRRDIVRMIASSADAGRVREGYALFDKLYHDATPAEQLSIATAAAAVGAWGRARAGFERAGGVGHLSPQNRFAYANSLAYANQDAAAATVFLGINAPSSLAGAAHYRAARALLAVGNGARARSLLRSLSHRSDSTAAASLSLLADLASDDGDDTASRSLLLEAVRRFPAARFAAPARFNAALIALILGQPARASDEFAQLATLTDPGTSASLDPDAIAAAYWRGRAEQAAGNAAAARNAWLGVIARDSTSYYATLAAARLGTRSLHPAAVSRGYPHVAAVDSAMVRIALLRQLEMLPEVQLENERLYRDAPLSGARLLATAAAFAGTDQASRAIALGRRALASQGASAEIFRLIYPIAVRDTIIAQARAAGIDPVLVAAVIRQESRFNARATSPAGARGLMQLMPDVARSIAAAVGIAPWSTSMLYDPGVNVMLGVRHLAPLVRAQPNLPRVLAAYNAGGSRVTRWARKRGADDPEMFTERIPFAETREYVKVVLRNREFYRALYAW